MTDPPPKLSATDAVRHLLMSFPEETGPDEHSAGLDPLVLGSLAELSIKHRRLGPFSLEEVTRHLVSSTGLGFDSGEVATALASLQGKGALAFTDQEGKSVAIDHSARAEVLNQGDERRLLEERVRDSWIDGLLDRHEGLDYGQAETAWDHLRDAITKLLNARSVEAASFLYVDRVEARLTFEAVLNEPRGIASSFPTPDGLTRPEFMAEAARFIHEADDDRTEYLLRTLSAAFRYHLVNLDPGASRLARSAMGSKIFYLDTNFLFRLLAIHGPRHAHAPALVVNLASELSTELRVARATLEEFKSTVKYRSKELRQFLLTREDFRRIAADRANNDIDFMGQFYLEWQSGRVTGIDEYESKYLQVERAIEKWGIVVDEDLDWDEEILERLSGRSGLLQSWHSADKTPASCDHDVLLEDYVREARSVRIGGLADVDVWFLTYDRRFTRFTYHHPFDGEVPIALLAEDWLQIVRHFSPRTQDFDRAFLALLASPLLVDDRAIALPQVIGVLKRLERYEGLSERVVAGMVVEQEFMRAMAGSDDPKLEAELVRLEVARIATRLEEETELASLRAADAERNRDRLLVERDALRTAMAEERTARAALLDSKAGLEVERDVVLEQNEELRTLTGQLAGQVKAMRRSIMLVFPGLMAIAAWTWWNSPPFGDVIRWRLGIVFGGLTILLVLWGWISGDADVRKPVFLIALLGVFLTLLAFLVPI